MKDVEAELSKLFGAGAPFESNIENVLGVDLEVFKNRPHNLREILLRSKQFAERDYLVYEDRRITFGQHFQQVASLAKALEEQYGVKPGDRIGLVARNLPEWATTFWAATSLGAVVTALNAWWAPDELEYALEHSEPRVLIGDSQRLALVANYAPELPRINLETEFAKLYEYAPDAELPTIGIEEDQPALMLFTSGTTGRSKAAVLSHRSVIGFVQVQQATAAERNIRSSVANPNAHLQTAFLCGAPLFHASTLCGGLVMMLASGAKLVFRTGRFDPKQVLGLIEKEKITNLSTMGSMAPLLIDELNRDDYDMSCVSAVILGGAPVSPIVAARLRKVFPTAYKLNQVRMGYGLTESAALAAGIEGADLIRYPTSTGKANKHTEIQIWDDHGNVLPAGEQGHIMVRHAYLMPEYWRNPEATAKTLRPGRWLDTGDFGYLNDEDFLFIDSRARDMILRAAENVYPLEIEYRLDEHPAVDESAVVGVDHDILGQEVKAFVVPRPNCTIDTDELAAWVGEKLANFKVPSLWQVLEQPLPRNPTGKMLKEELLNPGNSRFLQER